MNNLEDRMAQSAYANYLALRGKLRRMSSTYSIIGNSYSALATLMLDTALKNSGYLPKESYYGSPFQQPGVTYKDWIAQLKRAGILAPFKDEDQTSEKADWIRFKPGPVTLPYVNKEKLHQSEMASMEDLHNEIHLSEKRMDEKKADRTELEETKKKLEATSSKLDETSSKLDATNRALTEIADAIRDLQDAALPPDTEEKRKRREAAARRIEDQSKHAKAN